MHCNLQQFLQSGNGLKGGNAPPGFSVESEDLQHTLTNPPDWGTHARRRLV